MLSDNIFILPVFLKALLCWHRILDRAFFSFRHFKGCHSSVFWPPWFLVIVCLCTSSLPSDCFKDVLFIFGLQQFDCDVPWWFALSLFCLGLAEVLRPVSQCISPDWGIVGHYYFLSFLPIFSLLVLGIPIAYMLNCLVLSYRFVLCFLSLKLC